ncbi:trans-sulfuration enzyme family protein [Geothrix oryzisoli]|uniref:trans-sulfuration enzyme family protein n=1 Tax=Geothrix oryzisoli TaxID=2922721 RepID=UPI001FABBA5E|nr:PLP-dependent aspartate aminotransferase family protein [Geothrix oryzisoli]
MNLEGRFDTRCIHAGQSPDPTSGAIMTPVFFTSTYVQEGLGQNKGFDYARVRNPTRDALEANLAALEGGAHGMAFGSGMAAIQAIFEQLSSGDHVVLGDNVYGGTFRLLDKVMTRFGLTYTQVDTGDLAAFKAALRPNTKLVMLETPTNPMLGLTDIAGVRQVMTLMGSKAVLAVDNTFATPYNQRPLELGADLVFHSTTKYLNGHSDSIGGIAITNREDIAEGLRFHQKAAGGILSPMESWLILRGTKTLHLRMERHNQSALQIARWLEGRKDLKAVYYPGLESHPQHALAKQQMKGFSGIVSFDTGDAERTRRMASSFKVFSLAESLGGVESLVCHPASMTHGSVPEADRQRLGINDNLLRLSVGVEDVQDLIEDLEQVLKV